MRRVLLLGARGQLGSEIRRVAEGRMDVIPLDRSQVDICDHDALRRAVLDSRAEMVINTTAYHVLDQCETQFNQALATNCLAVRAMAQACAESGAWLVTFSTDYAFDGSKAGPYAETDHAGPLQAYGVSKVAGEMAALAALPERALAIRTCGLYAHASSHSKGLNFVEKMLRQGASLREMEVGCDLRCTPTAAADLADAVVGMAETDTLAPGLLHLTNGGACDWAEFTATIFRLSGLDCRVVPVDRRGQYGPVRRPANSVLDNRLAAERGFALRPWAEALEDYLRRRA